MLKLSPKDDENVAIWKRLPKIYWVARVTRAKPAAQVLLQDTDATKASRFGKMPVVAQQQYGLGQVLYVGTDNTWRWRRNADERFYPILWGQIDAEARPRASARRLEAHATQRGQTELLDRRPRDDLRAALRARISTR